MDASQAVWKAEHMCVKALRRLMRVTDECNKYITHVHMQMGQDY